LGIICAAALTAFIVDPYYRYRRPFFYDIVYYKVYATAPQLLRTEDYNLLMLGTSMVRNFFLDDINRTFNCNAIKLAASGGTVQDLKLFFDIAANAKGNQLKQVIFSLDIYSLNKMAPRYTEFDYMYRDDHSQDYRYLFSNQTFSSIGYLIKRKFRPKGKRKYESDRNRMFSTEHEQMEFSKEKVIAHSVINERLHNTQEPFHPDYVKNLNGSLLPMIDSRPEITFTIYLPPYHIYTYCQSEHFGEADALIKQRTAVMKELIKRKNITLHDFQSDRDIVCNGNFYSDIQHFNSKAARMIIAKLKSGTALNCYQ
jgi:hypothetical protein